MQSTIYVIDVFFINQTGQVATDRNSTPGETREKEANDVEASIILSLKRKRQAISEMWSDVALIA